MRNVIIKPLITEKSATLQSLVKPQYGFVVHTGVNKIQIADAISKKYNVTVVSVNTIKYRGKVKTQFRKGGRFSGKTAAFKKALITLKDGDKIELFEQ